MIFERMAPAAGGGLQRSVSRLFFRGARQNAEVLALDETGHRVSYFYGSEEADWRTDIPTSRAVIYRNVYDGIDLKIYGNEREIEYDWIVRPGADPARIRFAIEGDRRAVLDRDGSIVIGTSQSGLKILKPESFQVLDGRRVEVASSFRRIEGAFGFEVGPYDRRSGLVIDPLVLAYSTYLGGSGWENTFDIAVDGKGAAYVFGETESRDFPLKNPYQSALKGSQDAFLTVFAPSGKSLVSSTFLGGSYREAWGGIALDSTGGIYVVGSTNSPDFPVLKAYQKALAGDYNAFVLKFKIGD